MDSNASDRICLSMRHFSILINICHKSNYSNESIYLLYIWSVLRIWRRRMWSNICQHWSDGETYHDCHPYIVGDIERIWTTQEDMPRMSESIDQHHYWIDNYLESFLFFFNNYWLKLWILWIKLILSYQSVYQYIYLIFIASLFK